MPDAYPTIASDAGVSSDARALDAAPYDAPLTSVLLADWPRIDLSRSTRSITSFDRSGGNDDGFSGTWSELYTDADGGHVIFDALGPGILTTLWFTSNQSGSSPLGLGTLRFFFDNETEPRIAVDADALFSGKVSPFVAPLVYDNTASTGGFASYVPLAFEKRLKISAATKPSFYHAYYESLPLSAKVLSYTPGAHDAALEAAFAFASSPNLADPALVTVPLDHAEGGSGVIDTVHFVPEAPPTEAALHAARIQVWFDGAGAANVDAPLDMFFGSGLGEGEVLALAFTMKAGVYENRFPMPFFSGFRVLVTGLSGSLALKVSPQRFTAAEAGTFTAIHRIEAPTQPGVDYTYAHVTGAGKLVGTVLAVHPASALDKQWWEGDMRTLVDGARSQNVHGTGHEDDHLGGWSNEFFDGPFTLPMHGEPVFQPLDLNGQVNGNVSTYRLFFGVPFAQEISHTVEHGTGNNRAETYESLTLLYLNPTQRMVKTDSVDATDPGSRAAHAYVAAGESAVVSTSSAFEGPACDVPVTLGHVPTSGVATFTASVSGTSIVLRRTFDGAPSRQRAQIYVDGVFAGASYVPDANPDCRLRERDTFLAADVTGKASVEIKVLPQGNWDVASYTVFSVR